MSCLCITCGAQFERRVGKGRPAIRCVDCRGKHRLVAKPATDRERQMLAAFRAGQTLQQVGDTHGITRERVRQILRDYFGLASTEGGSAVRAQRRKHKIRASRDAQYIEKHGMTFAEWRALPKGRGTPYRAYNEQRYHAAERGIEWCFTFPQWWAIWEASGFWEQRGRGQGYVMCRQGDVGPYSPTNVFIAPAIENNSNTKRKKSNLPIGVYELRGKYIAKRRLNGEPFHLGTFPTPELAAAAYLAAGVEAAA